MARKRYIWSVSKVCLTWEKSIILNKCIYGLGQVARQYYKKAIEILKNLGFIGGNIHPCLYVKTSLKGIVYIALYLDDNLMVGNVKVIDNAISALKKMSWYFLVLQNKIVKE